LSDLEKAKKLFDEREKAYESKANVIIDVEDKKIKVIINELAKILKN